MEYATLEGYMVNRPPSIGVSLLGISQSIDPEGNHTDKETPCGVARSYDSGMRPR